MNFAFGTHSKTEMADIHVIRTDRFSTPATWLGLILLCLPMIIVAGEIKTLATVHEELSQKFDEVSHLPAARLQSLTPEQVLLLDVREAEEYAVSHLENAIQVDPGISNREFMRRFESSLPHKIVIFYCSVGYRSSDLAEDLQDRLMKKGATAVYNLEQGIFGWHNSAMPLVNNGGETSLIHPYDDHWGRFLNRRGEISYEPSE